MPVLKEKILLYKKQGCQVSICCYDVYRVVPMVSVCTYVIIYEYPYAF